MKFRLDIGDVEFSEVCIVHCLITVMVYVGDKTLKFVQQLCAAKITNSVIHYSTFRDVDCLNELDGLLQSIIDTKITIKELFYVMTTYHEYRAINSEAQFKDYLIQELKRK